MRSKVSGFLWDQESSISSSKYILRRFLTEASLLT